MAMDKKMRIGREKEKGGNCSDVMKEKLKNPYVKGRKKHKNRWEKKTE